MDPHHPDPLLPPPPDPPPREKREKGKKPSAGFPSPGEGGGEGAGEGLGVRGPPRRGGRGILMAEKSMGTTLSGCTPAPVNFAVSGARLSSFGTAATNFTAEPC